MSENRNVHSAGLFDIRNIIGALLGLYGIVLLLVGLFDTSQADLAKADGVHANIWVGLVMLIAGILFLVWARTRPIVVDEAELEADKRAVDEAAGRHHDGPAA